MIFKLFLVFFISFLVYLEYEILSNKNLSNGERVFFILTFLLLQGLNLAMLFFLVD